MGTHLWCFLERPTHDGWAFAGEMKVQHDEHLHPVAMDLGQSYALMAAMAGVRSTVRTRRPIEPIVQPRGLPQDISKPLLEHFEWFEGDAHDASWLLGSELLQFDWNRPVEGIGMLPKEVADRLPSPCSFEPWYLDDNGQRRGPAVYSADGVTVEWTTTLSDSIGRHALELLLSVAQAEGCRLIFWFDS